MGVLIHPGIIMRFPNAYEGIKKVFTSQILSLISSACLFVAAIVALGAGLTGSVAGVAGGGLLGLAGLVLSILALIFNLIGLYRASADEQQFKTAFTLSLVSLIAGIVLGIISFFAGDLVTVISSIVSQILGILIIRYVFEGISSLAMKLGRSEIAESGGKLLIFLYVVYIVSIVLYIIQVFSLSPAMAATASIMSLLANIASIVGYILYLVHLSKAKDMLSV